MLKFSWFFSISQSFAAFKLVKKYLLLLLKMAGIGAGDLIDIGEEFFIDGKSSSLFVLNVFSLDFVLIFCFLLSAELGVEVFIEGIEMDGD